MELKGLKLCAVLLFGLGLAELRAQESVNASGGNGSGTGGTISYSVGQMVYTTSGGTNGSSAQGSQQPFEISVVTAIEEAKGINLSILAYPNPNTGFLTLSVGNFIPSMLTYQLYDINGKLLEEKKLEGNQTSIAMSHFVPATYFVKVTDGTKEVKTFKIIKN
jgi:hypothetical protein